MKKKLLSMLLAAAMMCSMVPTVFAASNEAIDAANALHDRGLFNGVGTNADGTPNFDLDRTPTRHEAVTMLVAMLGKSSEALAGNWTTPFTDVADWAKPYVGYAYTNGLTSGTSATTYGGNQPITASQYLTFVLTALGYKSGVDFEWDKAWELSDVIGLTNGEYTEDTTSFTRGDVAMISLSAYNLKELLKTAPYFGLAEDIRWNAHPTCVKDVENNILYSFLLGHYSLDFSLSTLVNGGITNIKGSVRERIKPLSQNYPELVGVVSNTFVGIGIYVQQDWIFIDFPNSVLTNKDLYAQQTQVLEVAREIQTTLHSKGKITDDMCELEIANVYYNYLCNLRVSSGGGPEAASTGESVKYDSPYACLVNKKADCVGRAGAFNLLMHLEGISAQGVAGSIKGTDSGHVLSRVVLDGTEYFCDWGNKKGITQDISSWFDFDEESLEAARAIG